MKKVLTLSLIFLFYGPAFASDGRIAAIEIEGTLTASKEQILGLLPFKPGDSYSASQLETGVKNLKRWGIFSGIHTETKTAPEGTIVKLILNQGEIISLINIKGNYPYVETKILKRLSIRVGDMVSPEKLEEQQTIIKNFYEKMGYYNTEVEVEKNPGEDENNVELVFHIYKGDRLRYEAVAFSGVEAFRKGRMYSFIKPMDLYSERRLKQSIRNLENFYRQRGYLKINVSVTDKKIDWAKNRVFVKLKVSEGPKIKVFFRGNQPFRPTTMKKASELFEEVNFDAIELEDSSEKIAEYFRKNGYPEAKVTFEKKRIRSNLYHIIFYLKPGTRQFIYSVDFEGNDSISAGKLKKQIFTKERSFTQKGILDATLLPEDQKIAATYYQSKGFLDANVGDPRLIVNEGKTRMDIVFPVNEGEKSFVKDVLFKGDAISPDKKLLKLLKNKKGEPADASFFPIDLEQVKAFYANNGYPYATVDQKVERDGTTLTVIYEIEKGPYATFGEILILGDVLSSMRAIRQGLEFKRGQPYSRQKIINSQLNLRRLGAFSSVHISTIGIEEKETVLPVKIEVEERDPFTLSLEGQYSTDLKWAGTTRFNNLNAFGWGKQMSLLLRGGVKTNHAELSWFDPRFSGSDLQMTTSGWVDYFKNPLETSLQAGGAFAFFRQFHRFGFLTRYELDRTYNIQGQAINPQNLRNNTLSQITLSASFDTRDSFSDPKKGLYNMLRSSFFNEIKGLGANFVILRDAFSYYYTPMQFLTLMQVLRIDSIQSIGANISVPQRELLVLGGDDTIRGFKEDVLGPVNNLGQPVGGRARFIYNAELHFRVIGNFQTALFFDIGSLENSFSDMNNFNIRRSGGAGLRYITPVGPIRADYAIVLDRHTGDNFGRLHITFGYPF